MVWKLMAWMALAFISLGLHETRPYKVSPVSGGCIACSGGACGAFPQHEVVKGRMMSRLATA